MFTLHPPPRRAAAGFGWLTATSTPLSHGLPASLYFAVTFGDAACKTPRFYGVSTLFLLRLVLEVGTRLRISVAVTSAGSPETHFEGFPFATLSARSIRDAGFVAVLIGAVCHSS